MTLASKTAMATSARSAALSSRLAARLLQQCCAVVGHQGGSRNLGLHFAHAAQQIGSSGGALHRRAQPGPAVGACVVARLPARALGHADKQIHQHQLRQAIAQRMKGRDLGFRRA
jgi:hypothetical protein